MDEDLFSFEEEGLSDKGLAKKEKLLGDGFALEEDDILQDAGMEFFDAEDSLW